MGARDDVPDGARDREATGDRPPWSPVPSPTPGPARPADPEEAWDDLAGTPDMADPAGTPGTPDPARTPDPADLPVPDLLDLDLAELRTLQHPVLTEVLADLRARSGEPSEILWGFNNAF
ncbi:FxSxx-COOH cyclophane-containing RiPP peptide [Streptomyces sp. LN245]|uniref:FxSxx-COOH cyclophane-containing RiPP peptide n=1 Tax=Streptomyces sp. LN245 TaxID=3112975 RepID=UPI003711CDB5